LANAHFGLGLVELPRGDLQHAVQHYRSAIELKPDLLAAMNNLAWILATSSDAAVRDGEEVVRLATSTADLSRIKILACWTR